MCVNNCSAATDADDTGLLIKNGIDQYQSENGKYILELLKFPSIN